VSVGYNVATGGRVTNVTLRADNLFDVRYRDASSRIKAFAYNPGRNVSLVYKVLF
jgi:iron complex outermembrane receptor protein